ncbi:MAG: galactokinase [Clostridia bacterium]|nr:galactokinase [Clostridia bacterium]
MSKIILPDTLAEGIKKVYSSEKDRLRAEERIKSLAELFSEIYPEQDGKECVIVSAPGRTEICGNHTDHNNGKVMAAAVDLDAICCAVRTDDMTVRVKSAEYAKIDVVDLKDLEPQPEETGRSAALIRGVAARFVQLGYKIGGFDAVTMNDVFSGSGLSSSAAFEVLIATAMNHLFNDGVISAPEIAKIAQYAENAFFGKPCGLMDQMACSVGGFVKIDFADPASPVITPIAFDPAEYGYTLCITDTRADHADLTEDYAAIRGEMEAVAAVFGKKCLREVDEDEFISNIARVKETVSERAVLRALHFFAENRRVDLAADALENGDFDSFKAVIIDSGESSYKYNQNVFSSTKPTSQPVSLALALSERVLRGKGAWRVHGGGFAGTIQAFVPDGLLDEYITTLEAVFGPGACHVLSIRALGGCRIA